MTAEPVVYRPVIEGLFVKQLGRRLDTQARRDLARLGLDLDHLAPVYPTRVIDDCLELVAARVFGERSQPEAMRDLGRLQVRGFRESPIGAAAFLLARLWSRERLLKRMVTLWRNANNFVEMRLTCVGEDTFEVAINHVGRFPAMFAGMLEEMLAAAGKPCRVDVLGHLGLSATYRLTFT